MYESFRSDGFVVAPALFSADEVAQVRDAFMDQAKDGPVEGLSEMIHRTGGEYAADDPLARWPRMMQPHRHGDKAVGPLALRIMLDRRRLEPMLRELFGGDEPIAVQSMFYFKPPGARGQDLHQDNFYLRVKPDTCIAMWLAIDDADPENGGMVIVRGSGNMEIVCPEKADASRFFTTEHVAVPAGLREEPVNLRSGDVLFFNGSVIHGSYPNTSRDRFRRAFICHYVGAASRELANWYRDPLAFDGSVHAIPEAVGGGPCGTATAGVRV
jgi:ectoine hydroxylase-related dioxygenase (phytanoyl-CoA dioxygenase family)